ncbi:hypothetical protein [Celeribacter persicus]|uniref:Uncharacterized protein n=1 Tax=Celeribacter persicus TaxID=1651082 RepID=A0A2T5HVK9_9RHOB|nr:hypothetical protein [Celeribacter persicus]PTQ75629.1 hypothetical protein C8N42_101168 [Celeribacter persicus]
MNIWKFFSIIAVFLAWTGVCDADQIDETQPRLTDVTIKAVFVELMGDYARFPPLIAQVIQTTQTETSSILKVRVCGNLGTIIDLSAKDYRPTKASCNKGTAPIVLPSNLFTSAGAPANFMFLHGETWNSIPVGDLSLSPEGVAVLNLEGKEHAPQIPADIVWGIVPSNNGEVTVFVNPYLPPPPDAVGLAPSD